MSRDRTETVARLLSGCDGPTPDDPPVDMGMDSGPPPILTRYCADQRLSAEQAARLLLAPLAAKYQREAEALEIYRRFAAETLALHIAVKLEIPFDAVRLAFDRLPIEDAWLLDSLWGWTLIADTIGQLLGFPLDFDNPVFEPPLH